MLRINHYFFPEISVKANPEHDPKGERRATVPLINHAIEKPDDVPGKFTMTVRVAVDEEKSKNPPYHFAIEGYGIFQFEEEGISEDKAHAILGTVGMQILMGAIREQLASVTSRGPWGAFMLAPVTIVPEKIIIETESSEVGS